MSDRRAGGRDEGLAQPRRTETSRSASGRSRPPQDQVAAIQRARLLAAAVEIIEELGYARMTLAEVVARARVSRHTFYSLFDSPEDCFLAAFEQTHAQAWSAAAAACDPQHDWRRRVRSGLSRLLFLIEEEPGLAKLWIVEALGGGPRVLEHRALALGQFAEVVHEGRFAGGANRRPPDVAALGVVGGALAILHNRLVTGAGSVTDLLNPLMSMIVLPYLGPTVAARELSRPSSAAAHQGRPSQPSTQDPMGGLEMRLTYRTVRALMAIAASPGLSNRAVAEASGVVDQGQISKLLNRLERLQLIENESAGQVKGLANAWHLTPRGAQLERAARRRERP